MAINPATELDQATEGGSSSSLGFRKVYFAGVVGWVIGMAGLFGASWILAKPENPSIAMLWMISHCWIAFLIGLLLMAIRGSIAKAQIARPMLAYVLPMVLLGGIAAICVAIYPDVGFKSDLLTYLPVVLVFYCFSCLWLGLSGIDRGEFFRAVIPSLIGGLIILGSVAVPAFASDSFRYRSAFHLHSKETKIHEEMLLFDGELQITKPGSYEFVAPRFNWTEAAEQTGGADIELGEIQWGKEGPPKDGMLGTFPLRIVWKKGVPQNDSDHLPVYEESVVLEVRRPDQQGKVVYSISPEAAAAR